MLSLFLRGKECHISIDGFSNVYTALETREVADNFVYFLANAIEKAGSSKIEDVVFSSGPGSFTSVRIINSIAKGLYISDNSISFTSLCSFLPYLHVASSFSNNGILAIPTMRGDFFACEFADGALSEVKIDSIDSIKENKLKSYYENDSSFSGINLAEIQVKLLKTDIVTKNKKFISASLEPDYGYCPEYKF